MFDTVIGDIEHIPLLNWGLPVRVIMERYTIDSAAAALGITAKTLRLWMKARGIVPVLDPADRRYHTISAEQLEDMRQAHTSELHRPSRYDELLQRIKDLEQEIALLRATRAPRPVESVPYVPYTPVLSESTYRAPHVATIPADVPVGSIRAIDFARAHKVVETTLKSQLKEQRNEHLVTRLDTGARNGRQDQWVTPEQQIGIIALWRERHAAFRTCDRDDCACQEH